MTRKYYNHRPQPDPLHREDTQHRKPQHNKSKATSSLFHSKLMAKLERTPKTISIHKYRTQINTKMNAPTQQ